MFADKVEFVVRPAKGRPHALRVIRDLVAFIPRGRGTNLAEALRYAAKLLRHRAIVVVLSDFRADGWEEPLAQLAARHEIVAITVDDPRELELPDVGWVDFEDAETGRRVLLDTSHTPVRGGGRAAAAGAHPSAGAGGCGPGRAAHRRALCRAAAPRLPRARPSPQAMIRRHTTPPRHLAGGVRRAVWFAILGVVAGWRLAAGQGGAGWVAAPDRPTVGDTVWLERTVTAAPGWRVRAGKLEAGERVEPLGDPVVRRASSPDGWVVRYPV